MTPLNLVRHFDNPNMPFWRMLKEGNDHFEVTHLEPKIHVCEKRYVFDAEPIGGVARFPSSGFPPVTPAVTPSFNPAGWCPPYEIPREIALAVAEKNRRDESQMATLLSRSTLAVPAQAGTDAGVGPGPFAWGGIDLN